MNIKRDIYLTESIGECWHDISFKTGICNKCHKSELIIRNYSTWQGFGRLWEWSQKQEWWKLLIYEWTEDSIEFANMLVHPDRFADAVYEYLKRLEEK